MADTIHRGKPSLGVMIAVPHGEPDGDEHAEGAEEGGEEEGATELHAAFHKLCDALGLRPSREEVVEGTEALCAFLELYEAEEDEEEGEEEEAEAEEHLSGHGGGY